MWEIEQSPIDAAFLGSLSPEKVLYDLDGPRTFTARDASGDLLLLHQCGEDDTAWRYTVVPFSPQLLERLENGKLDLYEALNQTRLWLVDFLNSGEKRAYRVENRESIKRYLPVPGTMLYLELEPILSVRSLGVEVELGSATLGVLESAIENVRECLRKLAEYVIGIAATPGQPSKMVRPYYELPALLQSGSIRVSVLPNSNPQHEFEGFDEVWKKMEALLQRGLEEALNPANATNADAIDDEELRAALQAVYLLAPPAHGPVTQTEISGRLAQSPNSIAPIVIERPIRAALNKRLKLKREYVPTLISETGIISELDKAELTCMLRDKDGNTLVKLAFDTHLFDDVDEAFTTEVEVKISAEQSNPNQNAKLLGIITLA